MIVTVLINSFQCAVKYEINNNPGIKDNTDPTFLNEIQVKNTLYIAPKVYVVGVLLHEESSEANSRPFETTALLIDKNINVQIPNFFENYKGSSNSNDVQLPTFEVELGREPMEYLLDSMHKKFGILCWESLRVGISNQYGYSFQHPDDVSDTTNFGSSIHQMNPILDDTTDMGGNLLGTFFGMVDSTPDFSKFQTPAGSDVMSAWNKLRSKNKKVPAIYVGYTIGTDFNKIDPRLVKAKHALAPVNMAEFSTIMGSKSASYNSTPSQAFLRMALMLDNRLDNVVVDAQDHIAQILAERRKPKDPEQKNVAISRNGSHMMI
jgi:hypothetical protein